MVMVMMVMVMDGDCAPFHLSASPRFFSYDPVSLFLLFLSPLPFYLLYSTLKFIIILSSYLTSPPPPHDPAPKPRP